MAKLTTPWTAGADLQHPDPAGIPLSEYPRPSMIRDEYRILNGIWKYRIDREGGRTGRFDGEILVPFSPETALSGVERILQPDQYLHYFRTFDIEQVRPRMRLLLHFGGVDQTCRVYINGRPAGSHEGGYLAFRLDITDLVRDGSNDLELVCRDLSDTSWHARGKQTLQPGGMFYQAQSGIWKTVWMEWVPDTYITGLRLTPVFADSMIELSVFTNEKKRISASAVIRDDEQEIREIHFYTNDRIYIHIPNFHPWSPEDPHLYTIEITMDRDRVTGYFAMRSFERRRDDKGILRFFLNGRPYFCNGLLDQGYWPESLMTPPSDEAMIYDIQTAKDLGFNTLRKHIKIEPERWYWHCDRLGMLVWQDLVNGGRSYNMNFVTYMPNGLTWTQRNIRDSRYKLFGRQDPEGREEYYRELQETLVQLGNTASICVWVPFNEGWGQFDASEATRRIRALDRTRLVDEASGWFDQKGGDFLSVHNYFRHYQAAVSDRIAALTEYGGYSRLIEGHSCPRKTYGYGSYETEEDLTRAYEKLIRTDILPNICRGLSAAVYTQVSDIEDEVNGLLTWDRKKLKMKASVIRRLNRMIYKEFDRRTGGNKR